MTNREEFIERQLKNRDGKCRDFDRCHSQMNSWKFYHLENKKLKWEGDNGNK